MKIFILKSTVFLIIIPQILFAQTFIPGKTYFDSLGYVEYRAGNLPIIISATHGGSMEPGILPDRICNGCILENDAWTKTIAEGMYNSFLKQTGCYPHVIINLLHRSKFDANRDIGEAANGNQRVEKSWYAYHKFIESAKTKAIADYGKGLFLDIHGHGHSIQKIELGYLLSSTELRLSDSVLNTNTYVKESSIRSLAQNNIEGLSHSKVLRGQNSFGTLLATKGFPSIPSLSDPFPLPNQLYFDGGYNTLRHGSRDNAGKIDAIQIELNQDIRFNNNTREILIETLTTTANQYFNLHYDKQYLTNFCKLIVTGTEATILNPNFFIYPNPAENYFKINSDREGIEIEIYNYLGQKLHTEPWAGGKINIDFLAKGNYMIKVMKNKQVLSSLKFIKN